MARNRLISPMGTNPSPKFRHSMSVHTVADGGHRGQPHMYVWQDTNSAQQAWVHDVMGCEAGVRGGAVQQISGAMTDGREVYRSGAR